MEPGAGAARYLIRIRSCHIRFANLLQHLPQLVRPVGRSMNDITRWKCHVYPRRSGRERSSYSLTSLETSVCESGPYVVSNREAMIPPEGTRRDDRLCLNALAQGRERERERERERRYSGALKILRGKASRLGEARESFRGICTFAGYSCFNYERQLNSSSELQSTKNSKYQGRIKVG